MKVFKCSYQALDRRGTKYVIASSMQKAHEKLQKQFLLPLHIQEVSFFITLSKIHELENIFWQLGFGYNSGLNLILILESIKENLYHKENIALLESMLNALHQGEKLSLALRQHTALCGNLIIALFEIGEKSGYLSETCELCAKELQQKNEFKDSIKKALIYPSILALAFLGVFVILSLFVIPEFTQIYNDLGAKLPISTVYMVTISKFLSMFFVEILCGFCFVAIFIIMTLRIKTIKDRIILVLPIISKITIDYELYCYFLGLYYFLKSQASFEKSVETCTLLIGNLHLQNKFLCVGDFLHHGIPLSQALKRVDIHIANLALLESGEKSGMLDKALHLNAEFYKKQYTQALQTLKIVVEPLATLIIGGLVAFLALSIVSPMWQLLEVV